MDKQDEIKNLLRIRNRYLQVLKEQLAVYGRTEVPPRIVLEIEDIEAEIEDLQTKLDTLENDPATLPQRIEQQHERIADGLDKIRRQAETEPTLEQQVQVVGRPPLGSVEHFKNRVREREKIGRLLAEPTTRLVSVIGHGGMGKTALTSKILRDLEHHRWPHTDDDIPIDGIVYLSTRTAGISLEQLFLDCAKMLRGEAEKKLNTIWTNPKLGIEDKVLQLLELLKDGRYVILLDNMEDLLDDKGQLLDGDLQLFFDYSLTATHGARLLVTSRLALTFRREVMRFDQQVKLLDGLPVEDGAALLRELDPNGDYGLRDAENEKLAQAVETVHGVPRALEVIAGILANDPFASLTEVTERFYKQEDVVQSLIEENYKRLDTNTRSVIEALAVFNRPVLPLAVDYLLEPFVPGLSVPNILRRLTHTNIVTIDRAAKTVTLHPIDRDYTYNQLPEGGEYSRSALESRAADYYAQIRKPVGNWRAIDDLAPQLAEFEHRIRAEDFNEAYNVLRLIDNDYLFLWGYHTKLLGLREQLLRQLSDPYLQMTNLGRLGRTYHTCGRYEQAIDCYRQALELADEINDHQNKGVWLGHLGETHYILGQTQEAINLINESLFVFRKIKDRRNESVWLGNLGWIYRALEQDEQPARLFEEGLIIAREIGNRREEERHLGGLGASYFDLRRVNQAIKYLEQALEIAREIGDRIYEGLWLGFLGRAYRSLGQIEQAIESHNQDLFIARETNNRLGEESSLGYLGVAYHKLGQINKAVEFYELALTVAREIDDRRHKSTWLGFLGRAHNDLGQFEQARDLYEKALSIARETVSRWGENYCLLELSKSYLATGDIIEAHQYCMEARPLEILEYSNQVSLVLGIVLLHQNNATSKEIFSEAAARCRNLLNKTAELYEPRYTLATALVGEAVCNPLWKDEDKQSALLAPALTEYQHAFRITTASGIIKDTLSDLKLIQAARMDRLEPVLELLESKRVLNE